MAEKIKVNTSTLKNDTASIQGYLKKVQKQITEMQSDVSSMNKMWSGEANQAFNQVFQDDINTMGELCKAIEGVIAFETNAKTEYNNCEKTVSSLVSGINI